MISIFNPLVLMLAPLQVHSTPTTALSVWADAQWKLPGDKGQASTNPFSLPSCTLQGAHLGTGEESMGLAALCGYAIHDLHVGYQSPTTSISFPFHEHTPHLGEGREGGRGLKAALLCREECCRGKAGSLQ